ncbi:MAG: hypothetical protein N4R20_02640 [Lactobacillus iners]|nr:hypothetical protein [Lactobacillus iners]
MVTRRKAKSDKLMALVHELELEYGSIVDVPYTDRRLIKMQKLAEDDEVKKIVRRNSIMATTLKALKSVKDKELVDLIIESKISLSALAKELRVGYVYFKKRLTENKVDEEEKQRIIKALKHKIEFEKTTANYDEEEIAKKLKIDGNSVEAVKAVFKATLAVLREKHEVIIPNFGTFKCFPDIPKITFATEPKIKKEIKRSYIESLK